jgi:hypothetical protein
MRDNFRGCSGNAKYDEKDQVNIDDLKEFLREYKKGASGSKIANNTLNVHAGVVAATAGFHFGGKAAEEGK